MANVAPEYNKVKKILRALLLSAKGGCSVRSLVEDYKMIYGEPIPFKQLGFNTLMALLRDMPDAVAVRNRPEGAGVRLYGVPDKNTEHIAKMVELQKDSNKKKGHVCPSSHPPTMSMITKRSASVSWASKGRDASLATKDGDSHEPKAPVAFQAQIKTLFQSYLNGIALRDFAEAFARRFGYYFSYKSWGFTTLEQVLASIPEVVTVETDSARHCKIVKLKKQTAVRRGGGLRRPSVNSVDGSELDKPEAVESELMGDNVKYVYV